jgi:hypothetical protein
MEASNALMVRSSKLRTARQTTARHAETLRFRRRSAYPAHCFVSDSAGQAACRHAAMSGLQQSLFVPLSIYNYAIFLITAVLAHSLQKSLREARLSALALADMREGLFSQRDRHRAQQAD